MNGAVKSIVQSEVYDVNIGEVNWLGFVLQRISKCFSRIMFAFVFVYNMVKSVIKYQNDYFYVYSIKQKS